MKRLQTLLLILLTSIIFLNCEAEPERTFYGIPEEEYSLILLGTVLNTRLQDTGRGTIIDSILSIEWKKCSQGQVFRSNENDCQGRIAGSTFTPTDHYNYGAGTYSFCSVATNDCNALSIPQTLVATPINNAYSEAYLSCSQDSTDSKTDWRVPTIVELVKMAEGGKVALSQKFPNTISNYYWSADGNEMDTTGQTGKAVYFGEDNFGEYKALSKELKYSLRCVRNL